jgi:site-specific recombinase XerD
VRTAGLPIVELVDDFQRSLEAKRRARKTIIAYTDAARRFSSWLAANGLPTTVDAVEKKHVEAWIIDQIDHHSPSTAAGRYRYLQQFGRGAGVGKGDRGRWVPYSPKAATALDRYLRQRRRHPQADLAALWIGQRGALSSSGITQLLRRRARQAGLKDIRPHRFRHDAAHRALDAGMAEGDLQELMGWRSPQMLARYGASARSERARRAYRRIDLEGDL